MRIPERYRLRLLAWAEQKMKTEPNRIIKGDKNSEDVYMRRWYVIPRNPIFNIYLHHFLRSDDDRALHDHPWFNMSILLRGEYIEHTKKRAHFRQPGFIYCRAAWAAHRVELIADTLIDGFLKPMHRTQSVVTLFITGPVIRRWGFLCPQGWRYHKDFTKIEGNISAVGRGCE